MPENRATRSNASYATSSLQSPNTKRSTGRNKQLCVTIVFVPGTDDHRRTERRRLEQRMQPRIPKSAPT
jgi:hypothetical protein